MTTLRFQKGDRVVYKNNGLCLVEDVRPLSFGSSAKEYYVLRPKKGGTVYVPTEGELEKRMQKAPTKEDADRWIRNVKKTEPLRFENSKLRIATLDKLLASSDRESILRVLLLLSEQKERQNKRLCATEERLLAAAERIVKEEFAFALAIPESAVLDYVWKNLRNEE